MSDNDNDNDSDIGNGNGDYGPGAVEEPTTYRPEKGDDDAGLSSTLAAGTDTEQLRDGGPPPEHGVMTTTGGSAGPNSFKARPRSGPGVAPTTTGDATTGAMESPADGYPSSAAD